MNARTTAAAKSADIKTMYATRDFKDAGSGKSFAFAEAIDATEGEIANYRAGGLASVDKPKAKPAPTESSGTAD